ncbi:MAG: class I SAM-dependent methyltransferase [Desulfobacteraceae bacterium]|nr:class I SAM-dependent methyltransferase [Desulfobacteraceae bacterium]
MLVKLLNVISRSYFYSIITRLNGRVFKKKNLNAPPKFDYHYTKFYGYKDKILSVDYRDFARLFYQGKVPEKYNLIYPLLPGKRILEVGSGEGVFALGLSLKKDNVVGIDYTPSRYKEALKIKGAWKNQGINVDNCHFIFGDIFQNDKIIEGIDTLIARRVVYYFFDDIWRFLDLIKYKVKYICFIGNPSRSEQYKQGIKSKQLGKYAYYSTVEGMKELLLLAGFDIIYLNETPEPIVIGQRNELEHE